MIGTFSGTRRVSFYVLGRILPDHGTAQILLFFGIHNDWNLFRDSPGQFFGTRTDST